MGVEGLAVHLASRWNVDTEKVLLASLLHDYCKVGKDTELKPYLPAAGPYAPGEDDLRFPQLWHGLVATEVAQKEFGISDPEILAAVAFHSTGTAQFNDIGLTLFVADHLEPTRNYEGVSDRRRETLHLPLHDAAWMVAKGKLKYVSSGGRGVHPKTRQMAEWLESHRSHASNPESEGVTSKT